MKTLIVLIFAAGLAVGSVFYLNRPQTPAASAPEALAAPADSPVVVQTAASMPGDTAPEPVAPSAAVSPGLTGAQPAQSMPLPAVSNARVEAANLVQTVDLLVSPTATYEQKRAAWTQLADAGKLDQAITELEQRAASDPRSADCQATLGQAYLKKCAVIHDVREQGILAMQADKVFDTALQLDPANWDARFTKAVALSYWPPSMNKGDEVIQHFRTLIQQQETQAPQPQFAETYSWLGDQYQKAGQIDYARATWERGMALFPDHKGLKNKLASVPANPPTAAQ